MSVWKKTAKANQKTHKERHQPKTREHLGLLEKKKDYKLRAIDYNEKQATIRLLKKRVLNKNPDEFYHHMINAKTIDGKHFDKETEAEDTPDQLKLMRSQDVKYISLKRTQERRKIEKLQSQLHFTSVDMEKSNSHVIFPHNLDGESESSFAKARMDMLASVELPDIDEEAFKESVRTKKNKYKELGKRIARERELSVIQQKLEIRRHIESKNSSIKPKKVKKGNKYAAPVYKWKYERKK